MSDFYLKYDNFIFQKRVENTKVENVVTTQWHKKKE